METIGQSRVLGQETGTINVHIVLIKKWRGWDLNPEPMAYESTAPPLSYLATMPKDIT